MALSGYINKDVGRNYRLRLEWSATQSVTNNTSTVTAKLYWMDRSGYGYVNSSATKTAAIQYNDGSWDTRSASGMADLNTGQKKEIHSKTFTLKHNSDGTCSFSLDAYFDAEVTVDGSYYSRIDTPQESWSLNTIPRKSTLSSNANWTAGSNTTFSISRASSDFRHEIEVYIQRRDGVYDWIKQVAFSTSETSKSTSFSEAQNTEIFQHLDGRSSASTKLDVQTFNGNTHIGSNQYYGTVTAPNASTASIDNPTGVSEVNGQEHSTVYVDQTVNISISRKNSAFTHTLRFKTSNSGSIIHEATGVGTSYSWTPSTSEKNTIFGLTANSMERDGQLDVFTYYNGTLVRSDTNIDINYRIRNSNPTFGTGFTYKDGNSATVAITGNDQYIIQGKSTLIVEIPEGAKAEAINGASMSHYDITVNGVTKRANYQTTGTVSATFGSVDTGANTSLSIKAVDSRGLSVTKSKSITVIPYSNPSMDFKADRLAGFESDSTLRLSGSVSPLNIGGANKNSIVSATYRYKEEGGSFNTSTSFSITGFPNYAATSVTVTLDNTKSWEVEATVTDKLGSRSVVRTVDIGKPLLYMDPGLKSLGFGDFPTNPNEFMVAGRLRFASNQWAASGGGMDLGNSDIVGVNGVFFNDQSNNNGEGILWLKDGATAGSQSSGDYWNLRVTGDGKMLLNNDTIAMTDNKQLWTGAWYLHATQEIPLTTNVSDCPNGIILVWSDFDPTSSGGDNTENNYNFVFHVIPKWHVMAHPGASSFFNAPSWMTADNQTMHVKELFIHNNKITGSQYNDSTSSRQDVVLRKVYAF
jgi:hypothetical protein